MKLILLLSAMTLVGCANSQHLAQRHWDWLKSNGGIAPTYTTGVYTQTIQVNGQSYQVTQPYSR